MTVQDDTRELEQIELFGLRKIEDEGRSGVDAILEIDNVIIPFELKSTTNGSVTTVRDFGYDHILKWKTKHWLISKYKSDGITIDYSFYGSPAQMAPWIDEKELYIKSDFELAKLVPSNITLSNMHQLLGEKEVYSLQDALKLQKRQYSKKKYLKLMDTKTGYTSATMLRILQDRASYLIKRGSTLNNPHIPKSYFNGWLKITENHNQTLEMLVRQSLL